jgi:hypothetical protein
MLLAVLLLWGAGATALSIRAELDPARFGTLFFPSCLKSS